MTKPEETEKILFLDFDGVITTYKSGWTFDDKKLKLLDLIIKETQCKIVISSSWRSLKMLQLALAVSSNVL